MNLIKAQIWVPVCDFVSDSVIDPAWLIIWSTIGDTAKHSISTPMSGFVINFLSSYDFD